MQLLGVSETVGARDFDLALMWCGGCQAEPQKGTTGLGLVVHPLGSLTETQLRPTEVEMRGAQALSQPWSDQKRLGPDKGVPLVASTTTTPALGCSGSLPAPV